MPSRVVVMAVMEMPWIVRPCIARMRGKLGAGERVRVSRAPLARAAAGCAKQANDCEQHEANETKP